MRNSPSRVTYVIVGVVFFLLFLVCRRELAWQEIDLPINFATFQPDRTGREPVDMEWKLFLKTLISKHRMGIVPSGRYRFVNQLEIDLKDVAAIGLRIEGEGFNNTIIDVSNVPCSPQFIVEVSGGNKTTPKAAFFFVLSDLSIIGKSKEVVFQVGKSDQSDQLNNSFMNVQVSNSENLSTKSASVEFNSTFAGRYILTANGGASAGLGTAVKITQTQFSNFEISGGNAKYCILITDGYTFGNVFLRTDCEEVSVDVMIESKYATRNTFIGGQLSYKKAEGESGFRFGAIDAAAGNHNIFLNTNIAPSGVPLVKTLRSVGVSFIE